MAWYSHGFVEECRQLGSKKSHCEATLHSLKLFVDSRDLRVWVQSGSMRLEKRNIVASEQSQGNIYNSLDLNQACENSFPAL